MTEPPARTEPTPPDPEPVVDTPELAASRYSPENVSATLDHAIEGARIAERDIAAAFARGRLAGLEEAAKLADRGAASCRESAAAGKIPLVVEYHQKGASELEILAVAIRALIE